MTDYTIFSSFRNKENVDLLVKKLRDLGKTCHNFSDVPADPNNASAHPEEQMKVYESNKNFYDDPHFKYLFKKDLDALKKAERVILLLSAGLSAHIEIGIAFGLGKKLILIGEAPKPESLYLMFNERYKTMDEFIAAIK